MKRSPLVLLALSILMLSLSACQSTPSAAALASAPIDTPDVVQVQQVEPTATATAAPVLLPTSEVPTAEAQEPKLDDVKQAAQNYFEAVSQGNETNAAGMISQFSLMVFDMTQGDASSSLQKDRINGMAWSDLEILDVQIFDEKTALVHVSFSEETIVSATPTANADTQVILSTARDELWSFRLESGQWRYNWKHLIDFRTLEAPAQTVNGVTVLPVQILRFSDHLSLNMLIQNRTNDTVVFGQTNEILGTFHFGEQAVVAEATQIILNPLRSVPGAALEAQGLFQSYPDSIEIRKWKNYSVAPWYDFQLY